MSSNTWFCIARYLTNWNPFTSREELVLTAAVRRVLQVKAQRASASAAASPALQRSLAFLRRGLEYELRHNCCNIQGQTMPFDTFLVGAPLPAAQPPLLLAHARLCVQASNRVGARPRSDLRMYHSCCLWQAEPGVEVSTARRVGRPPSPYRRPATWRR